MKNEQEQSSAAQKTFFCKVCGIEEKKKGWNQNMCFDCRFVVSKEAERARKRKKDQEKREKAIPQQLDVK